MLIDDENCLSFIKRKCKLSTITIAFHIASALPITKEICCS